MQQLVVVPEGARRRGRQVARPRLRLRLAWLALCLPTSGHPQAAAAIPDPSPSFDLPGAPRAEPKGELLEFLRRVKAAFDAAAIGTPRALERVAGIQVLEWDQPAADLPGVALAFRTNLVAVQRALDSDAGGERLMLHYVVKDPHADRGESFVFSLRNIPAFACVTEQEVAAVFGKSPLELRPRGLPMHGHPPTGPRWYLTSTMPSRAASGVKLTAAYAYRNEAVPVATCLGTLSIASAAPGQ